jgi:hypothetical protein
MPLSTRQINEHGRALVQSAFVIGGIEFTASKDAGNDFVVFSRRYQRPLTVKVTANEKPKPAGGVGRSHLDWWVPDDSAIDVFALVDLQSRRVWFVETSEIGAIAQQHPEGRFHVCMATDPQVQPRRDGKRIYDFEFEEYLFHCSAPKLF